MTFDQLQVRGGGTGERRAALLRGGGRERGAPALLRGSAALRPKTGAVFCAALLQEKMTAADQSGDNEVDFAEFCELLLQFEREHTEKELRAAQDALPEPAPQPPPDPFRSVSIRTGHQQTAAPPQEEPPQEEPQQQQPPQMQQLPQQPAESREEIERLFQTIDAGPRTEAPPAPAPPAPESSGDPQRAEESKRAGAGDDEIFEMIKTSER